MNKNPVQTEATKRAFADALCQLAEKKPATRISVREIVERAGYNRSTFYQYFHDAYDLLEYVAAIVLRDIKANIAENVQEQQAGDTFIRAFTAFHATDAHYFDTLFQPEAQPFFLRCAKRELAPLLIEKFGLPEHEPQTMYRLETQMAVVVSLLVLWISRGRDLPAAELADWMSRISQAVLRTS